MKSFLKVLKDLKRKIIFQKLIHWMILGGIVGNGLLLGVMILSKWIYMHSIWIQGLVVFAIGILIGLIGWIAYWPSTEEVIHTADGLGFHERFITAYEILKSGSSEQQINKLTVEDALNIGENTNFKKLYHFTYSRKRISLIFLLVATSIIIGFIPNPKAKEFQEKEILKQRVEKQLKEIQKVEKQLAENKILHEDKKEFLQQELQEIKRDIKKSETEGELIQSIQKHQIELKEIENKSINKELKELGEKLSEYAYTNELGTQLQSGNVDEIEKQLQALQKKIDQMSTDELKELADFVKKVVEDMMKDLELKKALEKFADALKQEEMKQVEEEYQRLSQIIQKKSQDNKALKQAIDQLNKSLSDEWKEERAESQGTQNNENSTSENTGGQSSAPNSNAGESTGKSQEGDSGSGMNQGEGQGHIPNENIYVRELETKNEQQIKVEGQQTNNGEFYEGNGELSEERGQSVPYHQVIQQYKEEALQAMEEEPVPPGMRELVEGYFSSIE